LLAFSVLEECDVSALTEREQFWVVFLSAQLNSSQIINNPWATESYREKMGKIYSSTEWSEARSEIASRPNRRWNIIECSDGRTFPNLTTAARAFGLRASGMASLAQSQHIGRLGVRFRFSGDDWRPIETSSEKALKSRLSKGPIVVSVETRAKMSMAKKGVPVCAHAQARSKEVNAVPVVGISVESGERRTFHSVRSAAISVRPCNSRTAEAQISKACSGVKKSAYGYRWRRTGDARGLVDAF
jgi:hypothetical protein